MPSNFIGQDAIKKEVFEILILESKARACSQVAEVTNRFIPLAPKKTLQIALREKHNKTAIYAIKWSVLVEARKSYCEQVMKPYRWDQIRRTAFFAPVLFGSRPNDSQVLIQRLKDKRDLLNSICKYLDQSIGEIKLSEAYVRVTRSARDAEELKKQSTRLKCEAIVHISNFEALIEVIGNLISRLEDLER